MSKKDKKHKKHDFAEFDIPQEVTEVMDTEPLQITLNRMTVVGLRSLGAAMTDVTPLANGHVSEEQLACWGAHLLMMIFQSEDAQESIKELMLSANAAARLSELVEKVLSS